jgi:hypothetical protein
LLFNYLYIVHAEWCKCHLTLEVQQVAFGVQWLLRHPVRVYWSCRYLGLWGTASSGRVTSKRWSERSVEGSGPTFTWRNTTAFIWRTWAKSRKNSEKSTFRSRFEIGRPALQVTYLLTCLLTYSLTPWSRVLLEKLIGLQLVTKFPTFYGTRRFITAFTSACHLSLS